MKALSRRLVFFSVNEYDTLRPVADLIKELNESIYLFVQRPLRWEPDEPSEDEKQDAIDRFARALSRRVHALAEERVYTSKTSEWLAAFNQRGTGSTFRRAEIIESEIYQKAAPVPDVTPTPDRNAFLYAVRLAVSDAAAECDVEFR